MQEHPIREVTESVFPSAWKAMEGLTAKPERLWIQGSDRALGLFERLPERGLAIVGTRKPQARVVTALGRWISELAALLPERDLVIVSGFARGVDAAAHRAALRAGLPTIAVIGTGHGIDYPRGHSELRREILRADGLVVSEHPPGTEALPAYFVERNRWIAAWAAATWLVQAPAQSGALSTAACARRAGREVYALGCFPDDPEFEGNRNLLCKAEEDHKVQAFWDVHSLRFTWREFERPARRARAQAEFTFARAPAAGALLRFIGDETRARGGANVQDALAFCAARGFTPQQLFDAVRECVHAGLVVEKKGLLSTP